MIRKRENIVARVIHDSYFLIDIKQNYLDDKARIYEVNEIGYYIWKQLDVVSDVDDIDDGKEHYPIIPQQTPEIMNNAVNLLQPGEEAIVPVSIWFNFDPITEADIEIVEGAPLGKYQIKHGILSKYKNFDIIITVNYYDMYQNEYSQKVKLSSNMYASITQEGKAKHLCDINLKEATVPVKTGKRKTNSR